MPCGSSSRHFGKLGKTHPKMLDAYKALGEAASTDTALDAKTRELIALAVAVTTRGDGCPGVHAEAAYKAGASEAEVAQALATAISMNPERPTSSLCALESFEQNRT